MAQRNGRRAGYAQLVEDATADAPELAGQLRALTEAAGRGAHPDDVAAAMHVLVFGGGSPASLAGLAFPGPVA